MPSIIKRKRGRPIGSLNKTHAVRMVVRSFRIPLVLWEQFKIKYPIDPHI